MTCSRWLSAVTFASLVGLHLAHSATAPADSPWEPAESPLLTRWAADLDPHDPHPEHPRPQMVRDGWQHLNGLWNYAIVPREQEEAPDDYEGTILVPFPVESALSGVRRTVGAENHLWYQRTFRLPDDWRQGRKLLHFGAVDWHTVVWVNGQKVGEHRGGYDPFTFDITAALVGDESEQTLVVRVWDPTEMGPQPRGKQITNPHGIWYTPVTGIWQSVWLEHVPATYIRSLRLVPDVDNRRLEATIDIAGEAQAVQRVVAEAVRPGENEGARLRAEAAAGERLQLTLPEESLRLWSPDDPFLYDLTVRLEGADGTLDEVASYFGMRKVSLDHDENGFVRILLNDEPLFQYGTLDQGYWPDGLYTAPTDEALKFDVEVTREMGFNMIRKHVKVEPLRWYYWTDRLGLLVWQDMPNGDAHVGPNQGEIQRAPESAAIFERELKAMVDALSNNPSVIMWVPFNEGWGQFDTERISEWLKTYDPTRLVNNASGWNDMGVGDVHDIHRYPGPAAPEPEEDRAGVLGEFGGLGLPLAGHTWQDEENWGYRTYETVEQLTEAYVQLLVNLRQQIHDQGLAAAVYTQTTDVEIEVNGLLTYDREILKMPLERLQEANRTLFQPAPEIRPVLPSSIDEPQTWRYTFERPGDDWFQVDFDDSGWRQGPGGFGTEHTPGSVVRTVWDTPDIWIRRTFELDDPLPANPYLIVHHDEDVVVYVNGVPALRRSGYITSYQLMPMSEEGQAALRAGENVIAVHCHQTGGGQYIDVGIVELAE